MEKSYFFQDDYLKVLNKHYVEARLHTDKGTEAQKERMRELQAFDDDPSVILDFLKRNVQN